MDFISGLEKNEIEFVEDRKLANYTSFHIGGDADYVVKPYTITAVKAIVDAASLACIPYFFLGNGSNVLADDNGYRGVIILTSGLKNMRNVDYKGEKNIIECECGASLVRLCNFACNESLSGLEFAFGIPATVGGAIYMNAGAYGGEIADNLISCKYLDEHGNIVEIEKENLDFSYRHSLFSGKKLFILSGKFALKLDDKNQIRSRMEEYLSRRKAKQPLEFPSGGSTFKRPKAGYASQLIDECGLKGYTIGGAQISKKHAGFIINYDNASAKDVLDLVEYVKATVSGQKGIDLECEIKRLI